MTGPRGETLLEEGVVLALMPGTGTEPARVRVRLLAGDHCEGCPASSMCKPDSDERRILEVCDTVGVGVGDRVRVAVPGGAVLRASFLVYGLPLIMLLAGVALGTKIWPAENAMRDLWSFLLGVGLAGAAVFVVSRMVRQAESGGGQILEPRIHDRVPQTEMMEAGS